MTAAEAIDTIFAAKRRRQTVDEFLGRPMDKFYVEKERGSAMWFVFRPNGELIARCWTKPQAVEIAVSLNLTARDTAAEPKR